MSAKVDRGALASAVLALDAANALRAGDAVEQLARGWDAWHEGPVTRCTTAIEVSGWLLAHWTKVEFASVDAECSCEFDLGDVQFAARSMRRENSRELLRTAGVLPRPLVTLAVTRTGPEQIGREVGPTPITAADMRMLLHHLGLTAAGRTRVTHTSARVEVMDSARARACDQTELNCRGPVLVICEASTSTALAPVAASQRKMRSAGCLCAPCCAARGEARGARDEDGPCRLESHLGSAAHADATRRMVTAARGVL